MLRFNTGRADQAAVFGKVLAPGENIRMSMSFSKVYAKLACGSV
jgi:hypothetical protein